MKKVKSIDSNYLSDLGHKIQILPADEASSLLLEGSIILLFAGFPEFAYQGLIKLTQEEFKVSAASSLARPIKTLILALCYYLHIPCLRMFSEQEMTFDKIEEYIHMECREYEHVSSIDRWFHLPMPSSDWSESFIYDLTHPNVDIKGDERFKICGFLQDLYRIISQNYVNHKKWQEASQWLKIFEDISDAWKLDHLSYIEQEILILGIRTYLNLADPTNADRFIQKWWQSLDNLIIGSYLVAYLPNLMSRISEGALQNCINLSQEQAQDFMDTVNQTNHSPKYTDFIPNIDDWKNFLGQWNKAIFDHLDEEHIDSYKSEYFDVLESKTCLRIGATEAEVSELEKKLGAKLPTSYRNFLIASNGFTILNDYCELYGTDQIKWFIEENREWAECWDSNDVEDDKYFQYGEHQDCCWIRGRYIKTALQISTTADGDVYLLNPQVIDARSEWEAWDFGNKNPGAYRYRSFWDMMQNVYQRRFGA